MPGTMFISQAALAGLPTSGAAWNALVAKSTADPGTGNLGALDQSHPAAVFSIALRWAKDGGGLGRDYVINEIKAVMGTEAGAGQPLNAFRTLGAYALAADLVDMPGSTVGANGQTFNAWMQSWPGKDLPGHSRWYDLEKTSRDAGNNWGACARTSLLAVLLWLRKEGLNPTGWARETLLSSLLGWYKRWCGDTSIPNTFAPSGDFQAAWAVGSYPSGQGVINPVTTGTKAWQDGANCEDASRSGYPTKTGAGQHYQYESLDSALVMVAMLIQAGYRDAAGWGNNGVRRNYAYMLRNDLDVPSSDFHHFFWMQPAMANYLFPGLNFPIPSGWASDRVQRRMLTTHTDWLTSGGSTWLAGGTTEPPPITNPTPAFTVSRVNQTVTVNAAGTQAGSAPIARHEVWWGNGVATSQPPQATITEPTRTAQFTYDPTVATTYTITVRAVGTDGGSAFTSAQVLVPAANNDPVAVFELTPSPATGTAPFTVTYSFAGSFDPDGDPLTYDVDWGDGTAHSTTSTGSHTYVGGVDVGSYTVRAKVMAAGVQSQPVTRTVTVNPTTVNQEYEELWIGDDTGAKRFLPAYDSEWNGYHPLFGSRHEWWDSGGRKRVKGSQPGSESDGDFAVTSATVSKIVELTQSAYDAIPVKDPATLYIIP